MSFSQDDSQPSQDSVMTLTDEDRHEVLYFAYGSNLSTAQMRQRCPYSTPIGLGYLPGWRWIINERGFANIVQLPAESTAASSSTQREDEGVYGLLYLLPPEDEARLDGYEGVPWAYEKFQVEVRWTTDESGRALGEEQSTVRALVYVDMARTTEAAPKEEYVGRMEMGIADAAENWGLDERWADRVMRRFWVKN